ncbi:MAG TPA: DNA-processing protein DprA [Steroidobacteraceae bacterium]|jgi:DNA processing protein|nr:DNA-processing protein DprA [Steroidobacteraceae bacterium]
MSIAMVGAKLVRSPGLTGDHVRVLLAEAAGDLERICEPEVIARVELPSAARQFLRKPDAAALQTDLKWLRESGARLLLWGQQDYPPPLAAIRGAPPALYVIGEVAALSTRQVAIVGARRASPAGRAIAREFATALANVGLTITSGLAAGIDAESHEGALAAGGRTVAVLGGGIARLYPAENARLAERIRAAGALVSEFPPWTAPRPPYFPQRNRVISGLALGTLVVEAAAGSGALITAQRAVEQGREVFAVPGSIRNPLSWGCHKLIRDGAQLVAGPADVLAGLQFHEEYQWLISRDMGSSDGSAGGAPLDKEYEMLLDALGFEPATIDTLVARSGLSGESIASMLLILELEGRIAPYPGGLYGRISK